MNSQSNQYQSNASNSPITARFSTSTTNQVSPNNYGMSSTNLSASRGLPANSTVPVSSVLTPGGLSSGNYKADGARQSYSTNQMTNSASRSIGVTGSAVGGTGFSG
jgi:hypothetical protein